MFAAFEGNSEIVKLLLGAGADVNAADKDGMTSLMHAKERGHAESANLLLAAETQQRNRV